MNHHFHGKRKEIYHHLSRVNALAMLVVLLGLGLATVALLKGNQAKIHSDEARLNLQKAEGERLRAERQLWESKLAQAKAARFSQQPGRRADAIKQLKDASAIAATTETRTEMIAALALTDIDPGAKLLPIPEGAMPAGFDCDISWTVFAHPNGKLEFHSLPGGDKNFTIDTEIGNPGYVMFTSDGKWAAARNHENIVILNIPETKVAHTFGASFGLHAEGAMDFSPDGKTLACGTRQGEVLFVSLNDGGSWELTDKKLKYGGAIHSVRFSPDGNSLAAISLAQLFVAEIATLQQIFETKLNVHGTCVSWHPGGSLLAVAEDQRLIRLFNLKTAERFDLAGHNGPVVNAVFHPFDDVLVSFSWDGSTRFWNYKLRTQILAVEHGKAVRFSRDGKRLGLFKTGVGAGYWDYAQSSIIKMWKGPAHELSSAFIHPSGNLLIGGGWDGIFLWNKNGDPVGGVNYPGARRVLLSPERTHLLSAGHHGLSRWPLTNEAGVWKAGARTDLIPGIGSLASIIPLEDKYLLLHSGGRMIEVSGDFKKRKNLFAHRGINTAFVDPNKKWIAASSWHGEGAALYDLTTGKLIRRLDERDSSVNGSADGKMLIVATPEEFVFWNSSEWVVTAKISREGASEAPGLSAFSPRRNFLALTKSSTQVALFDAATLQPIADLISPDPKSIHHLSFQEDGRYLLISCDTGYLHLWDLDRLDESLVPAGLEFARELAPWDGRLINIPPKVEIASRQSGMFLTAISLAVLGVGLCALVIHSKQRTLLNEFLDLDRKLGQAQADLLHNQKMRALGTLAAGIAHDFNNLLSVIRMAGKLTSRETETNNEAQANLAVIEQAVTQGKGLVKSMLGYTRDDLDGLQKFSVAEMVEDAVPLLSKQFLNGITLKLELDYDAPLAQGSKGRLQQILLNLVVNASEALNGRGELKITVAAAQGEPQTLLPAKPASGYLTLSVSDNGPGIPHEIAERVFEPFFTTKQSGSQGGAGLGLSIVYNLAQQEGFGIALQNRLGVGVCFQIFLPVAVNSNTPPVQQMHSSQAGRASI